ncbi:MAG: DNA recombination protein RmuC [Bacteroidales bacterium]|nr:DNA recombination protein RmuC [Bacteroidales bacterium]
MNTALIVGLAAAAVIVILAALWAVSSGKLRMEIVRKEAEAASAKALLDSERQQHEKALKDLKESQEKAIEAARTALALENEKTLKAREESLKKEAAETMKSITGGLDKDIRDMKEAFDAQKKTHAEQSSSIKTKFEETVKNLREQTESIGTKAETLASALKGKNKMQGIFGETILENILKAEGLREGHDYDSEFWLRDKKGNIIVSEETGRRMRPDFALHFPDDTDVLIDSKVSLSALSDYFEATDDAARSDASRRNLESVRSHVKELTSKEYQKYVQGRKTLDYVIMFIPNYGAYQLAKQEDRDLFAWAFEQNVLITTEETLIPFLRLIRTAWVQKEQMENISEIVDAAQNMVDRVALYCEKNAEVERTLDTAMKKFRENSARLNDSPQSIVGAALKAVNHGIKKPSSHILPPLGSSVEE